MSKPNRFSILEVPSKFTVEVLVKDQTTGKLHNAKVNFTGETFGVEDRDKVNVKLVPDEMNSLWDMVIYDEKELTKDEVLSTIKSINRQLATLNEKKSTWDEFAEEYRSIVEKEIKLLKLQKEFSEQLVKIAKVEQEIFDQIDACTSAGKDCVLFDKLGRPLN